MYCKVSSYNRPAGTYCQPGRRDSCKLPKFTLVIRGRFVMPFDKGSFHDVDDGQNSCSYSLEAAGGTFPACPPPPFLRVISTFRFIFVCNQYRHSVICPKRICCTDQLLTQHTQAQPPIDQSTVESASAANSSLKRSYEEQLSCGESL